MAAMLGKSATVPFRLIGALGVVGAGTYYLGNNPDLVDRVMNKRPDPEGNDYVARERRIFRAHPEWVAAREHLRDPMLPFLEAKPAHERTLHEQAMVDRANAIRRQDREATHHY